MDTYTLIHVVISLVGIASGLVVAVGMLKNLRLAGWTALFLATTIATSVTGFGFPFEKLLPSHVLGAISLAVLAVATYALYAKRLNGIWRATYVATALVALYLNVFVLIVQSFLKVPALHALAPNQNEPPFAVAQLANLVAFVVLGYFCNRHFHPASDSQA